MKAISLALLSLLFVAAGISHFVNPKFYVRIVPRYLPAPMALVYVSGLAEIALGALLWWPSLSQLAAWGIIALLIAVFPANIFMFQSGEKIFKVPQWALAARLPIQFVLMAWAWWHTY